MQIDLIYMNPLPSSQLASLITQTELWSKILLAVYPDSFVGLNKLSSRMSSEKTLAKGLVYGYRECGLWFLIQKTENPEDSLSILRVLDGLWKDGLIKQIQVKTGSDLQKIDLPSEASHTKE